MFPINLHFGCVVLDQPQRVRNSERAAAGALLPPHSRAPIPRWRRQAIRPAQKNNAARHGTGRVVTKINVALIPAGLSELRSVFVEDH